MALQACIKILVSQGLRHIFEKCLLVSMSLWELRSIIYIFNIRLISLNYSFSEILAVNLLEMT